MQPRLHNSIEIDGHPGASIERRDWIAAWATVAANSFGGPAGQIAVMHDEIVVRRRWVGERRFLHALNYCMLLPGPEAQQLATYLGWLIRGPAGGLFAGSLFILPGFVSIMALSILFAAYGDLTWVNGLFFGISAAVIAVVANAVLRIGKRVIKNPAMFGIAASAFVGIFVFELSFPLIVAIAVVIGLIGGRARPDTFNLIQGHDERDVTDDADVLIGDQAVSVGRPSWGRALRVLGVGLGLWFGPVLVLLVGLGRGSVFVDVAWFFSTAAVLTFGGAYSVLAYISQEAVNTFGWLEPGEMISGLGMAETTPGPLIQVVQFVGFMGPYREPGSLSPIQAGISGAVIATWVTFIPSFLWIFLGAPFIEHLRGRASLTSALSTVTAAVVGVVLNLAIWFGLFTLFDTVRERRGFGALFYQPELSSLDWAAAAIAAAAAVAIFRYNVATLRVVGAAAVVGVVYQLLTT
ncbi:MAG: chromate efflux transporter [Acidimicrobiales bacterium]